MAAESSCCGASGVAGRPANPTEPGGRSRWCGAQEKHEQDAVQVVPGYNLQAQSLTWNAVGQGLTETVYPPAAVGFGAGMPCDADGGARAPHVRTSERKQILPPCQQDKTTRAP